MMTMFWNAVNSNVKNKANLIAQSASWAFFMTDHTTVYDASEQDQSTLSHHVFRFKTEQRCDVSLNYTTAKGHSCALNLQ